MASVVKRRSSSGKVHYYGKFDTGERTAEGNIAWKMIPTHQPSRSAAAAWIANHEKEEAEKRKLEGQPPPAPVESCGTLIDRWLVTLSNRNADDDRSRARRHVRPAFAERPVTEVRTADVLRWISAMRDGSAPVAKTEKKRGRTADQLSEGSMRANLNLLSRFFGWCVEEEHVPINPVRQVPTGRRPHPPSKADQEWIDDDATVRKLLATLASPVDLMFYLGNRSGLRVGELCGLRMSDLGFLEDGVIRVRYSYDGPLKEDKRREGKSKWVPAPDDAAEALSEWLARRQAEGAGPEALLFPMPERFKKNGAPWPRSTSREAHKQLVETAWDDAREKLGLTLTFYHATRHSFVSRALSRGASLDEVSAAVGHSSPIVTRRFYDHFVRDSFSSTLRQGIGIVASSGGGKILTLHGAPGGAYVQSDAETENEKAPETDVISGASIP